MNTTNLHRALLRIGLIGMVWGSQTDWAAENPAILMEEIMAYLEFVEVDGGTIFSAQIPKTEYAKMRVIDAPDGAQFGEDPIPVVLQIGWSLVMSMSNQMCSYATRAVCRHKPGWPGALAVGRMCAAHPSRWQFRMESLARHGRPPQSSPQFLNNERHAHENST